MENDFDPYRQWLGRTAAERPLDYYQLLNLEPFEDNLQRIETAEMIEMGKVLRHEAGPRAAVARQLIKEIEQAFSTLSDPARKAAYDAQLRGEAEDQSDGLPNYYQLLGLADFEANAARIESAQMIEMAKLLRDEAGTEQVGKRRQALEAALATLSDPAQKAAYDAQLRLCTGQSSWSAEPLEVHSAKISEESGAWDEAHEEPSPAAPSLDLSLPDEEEEFSAAMVGRAAPVAAATAAPAATVEAASSVVSPPADMGLVDAVKSKNKPGSSAALVADLWRQAQARQNQQTSASAGGLRLPDVSLKQIAKVAGGIAFAGALVWGGLILLAGGPPTGRPAGRITLDGKPVAGCDMQFVSAKNVDQTFIGVSGTDGEYQVSYRTFNGLPVGRYHVTITRYELPGGKSLDSSEETETLKADAKPVSYVFEQEIERGSNAIDFELKQGQKASPRK